MQDVVFHLIEKVPFPFYSKFIKNLVSFFYIFSFLQPYHRIFAEAIQPDIY